MVKYDEIPLNDETPLTPRKPQAPSQAELDMHMVALSQKEQSEVIQELIQMVQTAQDDLYFSQRRLQWIHATLHALYDHKQGA